MRQDQFFHKYKNTAQSAEELNRKWNLYLEQKQNDELMEMAQQQYNVNNAPVGPGAGGSRQTATPTTYYGNLIADGYGPDALNLAVINTDGSYTPVNLVNYEFYGPTSFSAYPYDTNFMWFVSADLDAEELVWGNIEMSTGVVTEVLRGFTGELQEGATSTLWHAGEETFYLLTNNAFFNNPANSEVWALTTNGLAYKVYDVGSEIYVPIQFFTYSTIEYPGAIWGIVSPPIGEPTMFITRLVDVEGQLDIPFNEESAPVPLTIEGTPYGPSKVIFCLGADVNEENEIIVSLAYTPIESESSYGCIARMDLNGVCTYIQDLETDTYFLNGLTVYPNENVQ